MINIEQRINLKLLVQLGKTPSQSLEILSKGMEITPCYAHVFLSGTRGSKRAAMKWKMALGVGGLQQAEWSSTLSG